MLFPNHRSDPFARARREAGLEPALSPATPRRRVLGPVVALAVAAAVVLAVPSVASGAPDDVTVRESALQRATAARVQADRRLAAVRAELDSLESELQQLGTVDEKLTEDIAAARRELREYAVAAYIDGGQTEIVRSSLSPEKAVALAWQSNMALGQSMSADEAADRFEQLKESNTPARLAAAAELDRITTKLQEAQFDAIQAAAHERDAESALTKAREAAARARAEQAAAEQAARRRAERAAADERAAQRLAARSAAAAAPAATPGAASFAAGPTDAPSGARGNPTAAESATLARIRRCESGGNYGAVSASGRYRGAYQFDRGTWAGVGGSGDPAAASPAEQDYRALLLLRQRGTRPWPICGR